MKTLSVSSRDENTEKYWENIIQFLLWTKQKDNPSALWIWELKVCFNWIFAGGTNSYLLNDKVKFCLS